MIPATSRTRQRTGEPASEKDAVLLTKGPHLVLDGLLLAARLIGARESTIAVADGSPAVPALKRAIAERPPGQRPRLSVVPDRFVTGEESALVNHLRGGAALHTGRRPFEEGILVQNVETLAHLALIPRHGACHHPDGALGFVASALWVFAEEVDRHRDGLCEAIDHTPVLPTPYRDA